MKYEDHLLKPVTGYRFSLLLFSGGYLLTGVRFLGDVLTSVMRFCFDSLIGPFPLVNSSFSYLLTYLLFLSIREGSLPEFHFLEQPEFRVPRMLGRGAPMP